MNSLGGISGVELACCPLSAGTSPRFLFLGSELLVREAMEVCESCFPWSFCLGKRCGRRSGGGQFLNMRSGPYHLNIRPELVFHTTSNPGVGGPATTYLNVVTVESSAVLKGITSSIPRDSKATALAKSWQIGFSISKAFKQPAVTPVAEQSFEHLTMDAYVERGRTEAFKTSSLAKLCSFHTCLGRAWKMEHKLFFIAQCYNVTAIALVLGYSDVTCDVI